jgi:hypothetical protein
MIADIGGSPSLFTNISSSLNATTPSRTARCDGSADSKGAFSWLARTVWVEDCDAEEEVRVIEAVEHSTWAKQRNHVIH